MVWRPGDGYKYSGRRADGWPDDQHAPDGYLVSGFRKVRKGGVVLASGSRWQDERLLPYVGKMVRYHIDDAFSTDVCIWVGAHADGVDVTPYNYQDHHSSFYDERMIKPEFVKHSAHSERTINNARKRGWNC